jgi:DNA-3-methyladenine glycosylase I
MSRKPNLISVEGGPPRCWWAGTDPDYCRYHDREWGFPVTDDRRLFEKISLEGFQAGLSWLLILRRREALRKAFADFDFERLARVRPGKVERLLDAPGMIRHRGKIESVLHNARNARELTGNFDSLARYFWSFEPPASERPARMSRAYLTRHPFTPSSRALSVDLRRRGWTFVGPTTLYAFMQAMGMVNDHLPGCHVHDRVERARRRLRRPVDPEALAEAARLRARYAG